MKRIDKGTFLEFEEIRKSGKYNMFNPIVRKLLDLNKEDYGVLLKYYSELKKKYMGK